MSDAGAPLLELRNVARYFDVAPPWYKRLSETGQNHLLRAVDGPPSGLFPVRQGVLQSPAS